MKEINSSRLEKCNLFDLSTEMYENHDMVDKAINSFYYLLWRSASANVLRQVDQFGGITRWEIRRHNKWEINDRKATIILTIDEELGNI